MRKPKQVLVFLYRKNKNNEYEYCIFYRKKCKYGKQYQVEWKMMKH